MSTSKKNGNDIVWEFTYNNVDVKDTTEYRYQKRTYCFNSITTCSCPKFVLSAEALYSITEQTTGIADVRRIGFAEKADDIKALKAKIGKDKLCPFKPTFGLGKDQIPPQHE